MSEIKVKEWVEEQIDDIYKKSVSGLSYKQKIEYLKKDIDNQRKLF